MADYEMPASLLHDVLTAIDRDFGTEKSRKSHGQYISGIQCPKCGKSEAFTSSESPWVIKCGRENRCGDAHHVKELFPHLFESWTERYQPKTEAERIKNPTAVADAYMRDGRGFDLSEIKGWYSQEWYQNHDLNQGSTTVRFQLPGKAFWERVLDKPERFGKLKARAVGVYKGQVWQAPIFTNEDLINAERIIITEGIFDAISWIAAGYVAVSSISCSNYPSEFLKNLRKACGEADKKRPHICFAYDPDPAGRRATKKFWELATADGFFVCAAQPPSNAKKHDWNDLHQLGRMTKQDLDNYFYYGDLLLAKNPSDKALLMYNRTERREFWFPFNTSLYWFKLDIERYNKEVQDSDIDVGVLSPEQREQLLQNCGTVVRISTAIPTPLYFQENKITNEQWYYFAVETDEGVGNLAFTPKQLTSTGEFKNRLLANKNAWWTGEAKQLERYLMEVSRDLKTVETIDYIGYSKEHGSYIYNNVAIRDGRVTKINSEDYFQFGRLSVKSLAANPELTVNTNHLSHAWDWPRHVVGAFGTVGIISTAFFMGSLFAEQVRGRYKGFPFFELVGEAGAGKSTLLEFLWKTVGRDQYEGFDPQKTTVAAASRLFNQVSNLPVVLIESDREATDTAKAKQFDWDDLKTAYNGRSMRSRGVKNSGNETYDPPFRGTIIISQNEQVMASEAILSRIVHITVNRAGQNATTKSHVDWLERAPIESLSYFLIQATTAEKKLLEIINRQVPIYEQQITATAQVRMMRIIYTHALMMALIDCVGSEGLQLFTEQECEAAKGQIILMAIERQTSINSDHPLVQEFWEAVDFIDSSTPEPKLNHLGTNENAWAINLKEFESRAGDYKLRIPELRQLKNLLRTSKDRKFVDANKAVRSKLKNNHVTKCWIFESKKGASND